MVCIIQLPTFRQSIDDPRDWSERFDKQQPPLKGEAAYVVMLVGIKRKARWRPRTADAQPPVAYINGSGLFTWTRSYEAAVRDVSEFNANQVRRLDYKRFGVTLWGVVGWGIVGYDETVRIINPNAQGGAK